MRGFSAAARAQWLAELVATLDAARMTIERLPACVDERAARALLLARIKAARDSARAMQLRRWGRPDQQPAPDRTKFPD